MIEITCLCGQMNIGKQGENLARVYCFKEAEKWIKTFGEGTFELLHQRNGDKAPYPVKLDVEGDIPCWKVTAADTDKVGKGQCELRYIQNDRVIKSRTWTTIVTESMNDNIVEAPAPQQAWVDEVLNAAAKVEEMANKAIEGMPTKTSELENDSNFATEEYVDEEIAKFDFIKVVSVLPEIGLPNRIYFVPKNDIQTQDLFDEFVWINDKWEWITTKQIEVDLTDYQKASELEEKKLLITYQDGTTEKVKLVTYK